MKYALVTGASKGIGRAICKKIAFDHGYHVLINYLRDKEGALETLSLIEKEGGHGEIIQFDVSIKEEVESKINEWVKNNNDATIEVLVNNAGIIQDGAFMFMEETQWDNVVNIKLKGFYNVTRSVIQKMLLNRFGRIITISSLAGVKGQQGQVNYSAANGGLIAATKALAMEIGKKNITVNAVAPGLIRTDMTKNLAEKELAKHIPAHRFGEPEEVADLVSFLVSKKASYISGEVININGGIANA